MRSIWPRGDSGKLPPSDKILTEWLASIVDGFHHLLLRAPPGSLELAGVLVVLAWFAWLVSGLVPLPQIGFGQDLGILLEIGWRFSQGQLPHRDYVSPIGPAYALIAGLPLWLGGHQFEAYRYLPIILCAVFSMLGLAVTQGRVPAIVASVYSLVTGLVAGGTYHLGFAPDLLTFATLFNRVGWAGVMVLAAAWGLPSRSFGERWRQIVDGLTTGSVLGFLLFLKMNYFLISIGMLGVTLALFSELRQRSGLVAIVVGFGVVAICFCTMIGWSLAGMARDLGYALQARNETWLGSSYWNPGMIVLNNMGLLAWWCVVATVALRKGAWRGTVFSVVVLFAGWALACSNSSGSGFGLPLIVTAILTMSARSLRRGEAAPGSWSECVLHWGAVLATAVTAVILPQIQSFIVWKHVSALDSQREVQAFHGAPRALDQMVVGPISFGWGDRSVGVMRETVELVRTFVPKDRTLMVVDFTNIVNFTASARSPRNTLLWIDHHATFARAAHVPPDLIFQDCDYVMVAKQSIGGPSAESIKAWLAIYQQPLDKHFEVEDDGPLFTIYRKRYR